MRPTLTITDFGMAAAVVRREFRCEANIENRHHLTTAFPSPDEACAAGVQRWGDKAVLVEYTFGRGIGGRGIRALGRQMLGVAMVWQGLRKLAQARQDRALSPRVPRMPRPL